MKVGTRPILGCLALVVLGAVVAGIGIYDMGMPKARRCSVADRTAA